MSKVTSSYLEGDQNITHGNIGSDISSDSAKNEHVIAHSEIMKLFDIADELAELKIKVDIKQNPEKNLHKIFQDNQEAELICESCYLEECEELIITTEEVADELSESYIHHICEKNIDNWKQNNGKKNTEASFRRIFMALDNFVQNIASLPDQIAEIINAQSKDLIAKLENSITNIIEYFINKLDLAVEAIMSKSRLDALKLQNNNIAMMIHQQNTMQQSPNIS